MHNYVITEVGNWYDEYTCLQCKKVVVCAPEDGLSLDDLKKQDTSACNICEESGHS